MRAHKDKFLILSMLFLLIPLLVSCGSDKVASDGATITINPSTATYSIAADTTVDFTVTVRYSDGTPYPNANLYIRGAFAEPRNATNDTPRYQFYYYPEGELNPTNVKENSGFNAQTDKAGNYRFSITVYGTVNGVANSFTDNIEVTSGSAYGSTALSFN